MLPASKSNKSPPTEKPPPPPPQETPSDESVKNQRNLTRITSNNHEDIIDKQEQEIIASLELEEREHKKYMDTVNAMRNLSPSSASSSENNARENSNQRMATNTNNSVSSTPQPFGKKSVSPTFRNVSPALSIKEGL